MAANARLVWISNPRNVADHLFQPATCHHTAAQDHQPPTCHPSEAGDVARAACFHFQHHSARYALLGKLHALQPQKCLLHLLSLGYEIVSAVSFTSSSTQRTKTKGSSAQQLLQALGLFVRCLLTSFSLCRRRPGIACQVLRPLERSVDRLSELENFHDLFRDLSAPCLSVELERCPTYVVSARAVCK